MCSPLLYVCCNDCLYEVCLIFDLQHTSTVQFCLSGYGTNESVAANEVQ